MTDTVEQGQERDAQFRLDALAAQQKKAAIPEGDWRTLSAKWCEGDACGERIPDDRRKAIPGVRLCVDCKELNEKEEKRHR